ncbi:MAG: DUF4124 domain-containing protein [Thiogranum sp.]|nr:DUF4124 domain-containing protein [Thiogranum sp.]
MNVVQIVLFAISTSLCGGALAASVYKSVDEHGNVVYTDEPGGDGKQVDLPPLSTYPAPDFKPITIDSPTDGNRDQPGSGGYKSLAITQPAQEGTVRDNTGTVEVQAALNPGLNEAAGHRFQFYLDGKAIGEPLSVPRATIENLDRGAHDVRVVVTDAAGNVLKSSESVRFYLHRMSQNFPHGPKPPSKPASPAN